MIDTADRWTRLRPPALAAGFLPKGVILSNVIKLTIPGTPVGQPRVQATSRGKHAAVYTPTTIVNKTTGEKRTHPIVQFKSDLRLAAQREFSGPLLICPVQVDVRFFFPRPTSMQWKRRPMPRIRHTSKPDRDNLDKAVLDGLTGVIWQDDCQVCCGTLEKWMCAGDESPRTEVVITALDA